MRSRAAVAPAADESTEVGAEGGIASPTWMSETVDTCSSSMSAGRSRTPRASSRRSRPPAACRTCRRPAGDVSRSARTCAGRSRTRPNAAVFGRQLRTLASCPRSASAAPTQKPGGARLDQLAADRPPALPAGSTRVAAHQSVRQRSALPLDTIGSTQHAGYAVSRQIRLQGVYMFTRQDSYRHGRRGESQPRRRQLVLFNPMRIP